MQLTVKDIAQSSHVSFGTSGARGLVTDITDRVAYCYTQGFLRYLKSIGHLSEKGESVAIAGDLRSSTDRIMRAVGKAVADCGYGVVNLGKVPTPTGAYYGVLSGTPFIMITGSHIPDDRNGIKYYKAHGEEILKTDEVGMLTQNIECPRDLFDDKGCFFETCSYQLSPSTEAVSLYTSRYIDFFGLQSLQGMRVGLYEHSAVGRDLLCEILYRLGAEVVPFGRSEVFIPVDTEVLPEEKRIFIEQEMSALHLETVVSTDGDSDRPLFVVKEGGRAVPIHGDRLNIISAQELNADVVVVTVSSNTGIEVCGQFQQVSRTKIGSPYVIARLNELHEQQKYSVILGYEANGGLILRTDVHKGGKRLRALATRDAVLPIILALAAAHRGKKTPAALFGSLPQRYTASTLQDVPAGAGSKILDYFRCPSEGHNRLATLTKGLNKGKILSVDQTDGLRVFLEDDLIVHLRPSGNAPQFRVYCEAATQKQAEACCQHIMSRVLHLPAI